MYRATTQGIEITVEPFYLEERSEPMEQRYFWAYRVTIANRGDNGVKLVSRHWRITDATGHLEEVRGPGVVGEQPELEPGDTFQYTSGCPLTTSSGFMEGDYTMRDETGQEFEVAIPPFSLDLPGVHRSVN
ncbi:Co2+/Mg2+ efflux protein ApaG [Aliihoeflea aestuarii]|jgi:ApaG protein|uniref:Co2+/Mg2+ efflux protein ApaG n=1 Tax=Aliihoeflea aestuarii TaxID=453840 RepID=UPI0020939200|nr:Co2+/Mg2+ efflux protein ApaG [Aliihoeflea aestuarii]MCO6389837.1 Co2+/Mg2+ efflux protein ApaG [Aliihoeflea aestuarii]